MKILILNGPNLNLLGTREPGIYGDHSFDTYFPKLQSCYPNIELEYYQSNIEGELIIERSGYIEGEKPLPPTEMRMTTREYFDFEAKYNGECQEVTPAEFAPELTARIQELVKNAHYALGGAGYSRTDVRITKDGELFAIETNTLPGMTPTSLLPQQAACVGITYSQLIDLIIDKSLEIKR